VSVGSPTSSAQGRWRGDARRPGRSWKPSRLALGLALFGVALVGAALVTGTILAPLFRWQTAAIALVIDQYELGVIEPVPFGTADRRALSTALAGLLDTGLGRDVVELTGLEAAEGLRELLLPRMKRMNLRSKDVMIAYVRGQSLVAPRAVGPDARDTLAGRACFLASDCSVAGQRPRELVPVRDIVEAVGAAPPYVTLHALDLGDITWDPRLGVLANSVARALDVDLAAPQTDARYHNWVLGSHDLFQHSSVDLAGGRTYFGRALELALGGAADAAPDGDADGVVELHEVVQFVKSWTAEWVRRATGGRVAQTPVVWKLGVGRIDAADVPRDVALVRLVRPAAGATAPKPGTEPPAAAPRPPADARPAAPVPAAPVPAADAAVKRTAAEAPAAKGSAAEGSAAEGSAAAGQPPAGADATPAAEPKPGAEAKPSDAELPAASGTPTPDAKTAGEAARAAQPESPPAVVPPVDAWQALQRLGERTRRNVAGAQSGGSGAPGPIPPDFAPHRWARVFCLAASADVRRHAGGPFADRSQAAFDGLGESLSALWSDRSAARGLAARPGDADAVALLRSAIAAAERGGFEERWTAAPPVFCQALAARNTAVQTLISLIDVTGRIAGGTATPPIDPARVRTLIGKVAVLTAAIRRFAAGQESAGSAASASPIETATRAVVAETAIATELLERVAAGGFRAAGSFFGSFFGSSVAALRSPVVSSDLREAIRRRVAAPAGLGDPASPDGPLPPVVEIDVSFDATALEQMADRVLGIVSLIEACVGDVAIDAAGGPDLRDLAADLAAVRLAASQLTQDAADQRVVHDRVTALGGLVAQAYARITDLVRPLRDADAADGVGDAAAGLLRMIDPRDVALIDRTVVATLPVFRARGTSLLQFVADGPAALSIGRPIEGRLVAAGSQPLPADAVLRFAFDPADIRVVVEGGRDVDAGMPLPAADLPFVNNALGLKIVASRERVAAGDEAFATLRITCESQALSATADIRLELPARRGLVVAVRRSPPEPDMERGGWRVAVSDDAQTTEAGGRPGGAARAVVDLVAIPGSPTAWEVGLENPAEIARTFAVRLVQVPAVDAVNAQAGRVRSAVWSEFCAAAEGGAVPEPIAAADKLSLAARDGPVVAVLAPAKPAAEPLPAPSPREAAPPQPPPTIGPDLALVVTETTPGEPARVFLVRLRLTAERPRQRLKAVATWSAEERLIAVRVEPVDAAAAASLPAEGLKVALEPLPPALVLGRQPVALRRSATVLTRGRPADTLTAVWQGSDVEARAGLALSVNGYPRAFVFNVDCTAAAAGVPQQPQNDFRAIAFAGPRPATEPPLKAPAEAIPIGLLVDAPPDVSGGRAAADVGPTGRGETVVSLSFRGLRAGGAAPDAATVVWSAAGDRQVSFLAGKPQPPAAVAVTAVVADWAVAPSGEGYVDLDLEAEAALAVPGMPAPLKAARTFIMDGRPPAVEVPALVNATVGRPLVVPARVVDDPAETFAALPGRHIPGVSGVERVEWALDLKGNGAPEAWTPAVGLGGGSYEIKVDTALLPPGARTPLLVRATDRVGLAHPPSRVWLDTAPAVAKGSIEGRVTLKDRGEPNVTVRIDGPNAPAPVRSGTDGRFTFSGLDPGTYTLKAVGPVRNRTCASEATPAVVAAPPAPPAKVTLELK